MNMFNELFSSLTGSSGVVLGFGLGFVMWLSGSVFSAIFSAFDVGTGLEDIDTSS